MANHSYREHMTTTSPGEFSNYVITCSRGWSSRLASISDVFAAKLALEHVEEAQTDGRTVRPSVSVRAGQARA
jgi:hypothetical protein